MTELKPFVVEFSSVFDSHKILRLPIAEPYKFIRAIRQAVEVEKGTDIEVFAFNKTSQSFECLVSVKQLQNANRLRIEKKDDAIIDPPLALPWKDFSYDFAGGEFRINNKPLYIEQMDSAELGTGLTIWDGSVVLAKYLEQCADVLVKDKRVIELGCGTGLVGIAAGILGAKRVVLTDLQYTHSNINKNIRANTGNFPKGTKMSVKELDWLNLPERMEESYDLILASDVVWLEGLVRPLVETFAVLFRGNGCIPEIIMSYQSRSVSTDRLLESTLAEFQFQLVLIEIQKKVKLYRLINK